MYRPLRTMLFIPGNRQKLLDKVPSVGADAVVLDLEDAVPLPEKSVARDLIKQVLARAARGYPAIYVRVNSVPGLLQEDLAAVVSEGLRGICLPKAEGAGQVQELAELLAARERQAGLGPGRIKINAIVETAAGVLKSPEIASAHDRLEAVSFGAEDFTLDMGIQRSRDGREIDFARNFVVLSAVTAGIRAVDTVFTDLEDERGLREDASRARQLGYHGKYALHPGQLATINRIFSPSDEEIERSRRIVAAFSEAQCKGSGAVRVDGKMVDAPVARKAEQVLALAEILGITPPKS